jgi:hypothetical protein
VERKILGLEDRDEKGLVFEREKNIFSLSKTKKARFRLFYHTRWFSKENGKKDNT